MNHCGKEVGSRIINESFVIFLQNGHSSKEILSQKPQRGRAKFGRANLLLSQWLYKKGLKVKIFLFSFIKQSVRNKRYKYLLNYVYITEGYKQDIICNILDAQPQLNLCCCFVFYLDYCIENIPFVGQKK